MEYTTLHYPILQPFLPPYAKLNIYPYIFPPLHPSLLLNK